MWTVSYTHLDVYKRQPLCSVPGCGHSDAACPAYIEGNNVAVAAIGGNVYLMGSVYGLSLIHI